MNADAWRNNLRIMGAVALLSFVFGMAPAPEAPASTVPRISVRELRCEYLRNPAGIDTPSPRLSWILESGDPAARGQRQTAFQVLVSGSRENLAADIGDLWDSGKTASDRSIHVRYAGKDLSSEQECFWKVRIWDENGAASPWGEPAYWSMGLLAASDWKAEWIGRDGPERKSRIAGTSWIWFPEGKPAETAPTGERYFRRAFELPEGQYKSAVIYIAADNEFTAWVNGDMVGSGSGSRTVTEYDLRGCFRPGRNVLAVSIRNTGTVPSPAGFLAFLRIGFGHKEPMIVPTDKRWVSSADAPAGWEKPEFKDLSWTASLELGPAGMAPWGEVSGEGDRRLEARWLRREFPVNGKVRRAVAYMSGLGLSEMYLNGKRVGDHVLSPGLTEYSKRVYYVARDVTKLLKPGANAVGVVLGNGRFFAPRGYIPDHTLDFGFPKLFFQMRIEYADGSSALVAGDETWKLTTDGPIRANNEYDGEEYDARMEIDGWSEPGFDDSGWSYAGKVGAPAGALVAQMIDPIRVTAAIKPVAVTEPRPGVFIFDMGQNMVGWCRLRVSGPRGTEVRLRHAEALLPDGMLYLDPMRTAGVTDAYTLRGRDIEVYEPRFTYHGFRYVEVTGYPGRPGPDAIEGLVVNDDLEVAGDFACSNPLIERILGNVAWGVRGNYRSIPTDCPQRDERQGWLGDRSAESRGETYLFQNAALYAKWIQDMADAQRETGSVPDVCPPYWPIFNDDVSWPSSTVIIPGNLLDQFGDTGIIERHYPSAKRWMDHMAGYLKDGIIPRDTFGDWCVPPEDLRLINSADPNRNTKKELLATAYFHHDARLMARYARILGKDEDARGFEALAGTLAAAFNREFWNEENGWYDNGSQTSCVLPLAFGMVPEGRRERVFGRLIDKITNESLGHIGTGLVGGQWLMRTLTDNGRADVAYGIAAQKTYPGWGYMIEKGATTIWELWNGDLADPTMNSGNHVMLVGDFVIWLYERLAGIRPDPEQPGFKHIVMRPEPAGDLTFVRATHLSPFGPIASGWKKEAGAFRWSLTIPLNAYATVYVPAEKAEAVTESGRPAAQAPGVKFVRFNKGRAVFAVGSGTYLFESK
jgi:alpha-L-rhamnosidase